MVYYPGLPTGVAGGGNNWDSITDALACPQQIFRGGFAVLRETSERQFEIFGSWLSNRFERGLLITSRDIWHVYPRSLQMLPGIVHEAPGSGAFVSAAKCPTPRPKNSFENIFKNSTNTELHDQHFNRKQNHDKPKPENHQQHKLTTPLTPIPAKKR